MEQTLHALGEILLKAVPTFLLVILLHFYLKKIFFKPLEHVLEKRYEATEGARKLADQSLEKAAAKTAEYEAAIRAARTEIYQAEDKLRQRLQSEQVEQLAEVRRGVDGQIKEAKAQLAAEVVQAKVSLATQSDALASQIADAILRGRAA